MVLLLASFFMLSLSLFFNKRLVNSFYGAAIGISLFTAGIFSFIMERNSLSDLNSKESMFTGIISDYPLEKERSLMLKIRLDRMMDDSSSKRIKGSLVLYLRKDSSIGSYRPGDSIVFWCTPLPITNRGNPEEFDYRFYMESHGFRYYALAGSDRIRSCISPSRKNLRYAALIIRNRIISMFEERGISGRRLALLAAITLGDKDHIDPEQKESFIKSGVMHIMAVSGLHAVILSWFIFKLLFFLGKRLNILRVALTVAILVLFAFVTGLTPSVVRAVLMFTFIQAGNLLRRPANGINSALASALVLILSKPSVIFDAGFLLSYAAVIFIIGFYREMNSLLDPPNRFLSFVWQSASVTLVAQAGTLPLTVMLFNRFPVYFLAANLLIVPLTSLLIIIACFVPITYPLRTLSAFIAWIVDRLTALTEIITSRIACLPGSSIEGIGLTLPESLALFAVITLVLRNLLLKPSGKIIYPLFSVLIFVSLILVRHIKTDGSNELVVYNSNGYYAIGIRQGSHMELITDNPVIPDETARHSAVMGVSIKRNDPGTFPFVAETCGIRILAGDTINIFPRDGPFPDLLILTGRKPYISRSVVDLIPEKTKIIVCEATNRRLTGIDEKIGSEQLWIIKQKGAYTLTISR